MPSVPGAVAGTVLVLLFVLASAIVAPLLTTVLLTVVHLAVNEILGVRRWTAVLAYPAVFVFVSLVVYALARRAFVWDDRRYRWRGKFDMGPQLGLQRHTRNFCVQRLPLWIGHCCTRSSAHNRSQIDLVPLSSRSAAISINMGVKRQSTDHIHECHRRMVLQ